MLAGFLEPPEFLASHRVIGVVRLGSAAQEHWLAFDDGVLIGGKGLAKIAVGVNLAVGKNILVIDRAIGLPHGFARFFVQGRYKLIVAPVKIHDDEVAINYG